MKKIFLAVIVMTMAGNSFAGTIGHISYNPNGSQTLIGHVPLAIQNSVYKYHASQYINAQIVMPLSNQSQLDSVLQDLYNPKSPNFHHFLTSAQFAQEFAPMSSDSIIVQEFLNREGLYVIGQSPNGMVLNVTGTVSSYEHAFGLHINYYQRNSDGLMFYAPDADPTIPVNLAGKIIAVGGLDNLPKYQTHLYQQTMNALPQTAGSGPGGYLAPGDVKTAYNLNSVPATGSGQSVALFELDGYQSKDITAYESKFSLPNVPLQNTYIDGFSGVPNYGSNGGAAEVTLDIELVAAFAPGSSNIFVYEAPNSFQGWEDEWTKIASDDKAKVISCSWGEPEMDSPTLGFDNEIFQEMAAQGQAVFVAAGDNGAFDAGPGTLSVDEPASQPFVTAVGISKLTMGSGSTYVSETASVYGGGGFSEYWSIPSYQTTLVSEAVKAAKVSNMMRNLPDVVLTADASTAYSFYINGGWAGYYGSSLSAPIWASFISRVNQGLGSNAPIGSVNTVLYALAQSSSYANDFHDITTGNNRYYPAESGFDDATGLGSFNGLNLYNDLVKNSAAVTPPLPPAGLEAIGDISQVSLFWSASAGATSYNVERSTVSGSGYTLIASSVTNTTYTDNSVSNGTTYYYVVSAVNAGGQSSNSSQVSASPVLPVPSAPVGLGATAGNGQVSLSWTVDTGATSYNVKRATVSGGPYTTITSPATNSYTDNSVSNGTNYYYVVSAVNASGQSANSSQVSASPVLPAPSVPVGLGATASNSQVSLSWTTDTGATSYNVGRSTVSGGPYTTITSPATNSYTDNSVSNGTTYYYVVSAVNAGGQSANSSQVSASPVLPVPSAPVGLGATAGNGQVSLSWTVDAGATSYNVKRAIVSGGPYTTITSPATNSYTDNSVSNGTIYYYVVSAVNAGGQSSNSAQVSASPVLPVPSAPVGLGAAAGNGQVSLSWTVDAGATSYNVKRATVSGGPYTTITSPATNSYTDNSVSNGTIYYYVVSAVNAGGQSANSSQVSATPVLPVPSAPVGLGATAGNGQVSLSWTVDAGATSYNVKRATVSGGPYTTITSPATNSYTDNSVSNGTNYYYVVSAVNASGQSANSSQVSASPVLPVPSAPVGLGATAGNGQVSLSWTVDTGSTSYNVKRATVSGGPYTTITSPATNSYTDNSVSNGTNYYYVVSAVNASGQSANSSQVSASPVLPAPSVPVGLGATASNSQVSLSWTTDTGATSYNVGRSTVSGGPYTTITSPATNSYTDNSVSNGTTYYYVVSAVNAGGQSANSAEVSATYVVPNSQPAPSVTAVSNLNASNTVYQGKPEIIVTWNQSSSPDVVSNNVYYSKSGGAYVKLNIQATTSETIVVSGGVFYNMYVTAVDSNGVESPASNGVSVIMPAVRL